MANVPSIRIRAVNGNNKSQPVKVYRTSAEVELPKQFVLRLDTATNNQGEEVIRVNNGNYNLIASHNPEWLEGVVTGFRRDQGDVTYIIAEVSTDDMPAINKLANVEAY